MVGKIIRYMRVSSGTSQIELAKTLGIGQTTLSGYERGFSMPNYDMVEKIADICDYEIVFVDKNSNEPITAKNIDGKI